MGEGTQAGLADRALFENGSKRGELMRSAQAPEDLPTTARGARQILASYQSHHCG
jgi:hypothetical protein